MKIKSVKFPAVLCLLTLLLTTSCSKDEINEPPIVSSIEVFDITNTSAKCFSEISTASSGKIASKGVCYGTAPDPTVNGSKTDDGNGFGSFISKIENLEANKEYFVRAYATNEAGTSYGENILFKTSPEPIIKGHLNLQSQEEIDFIFKSSITTIEGDLVIGSSSGWSSTKIESLESMNSLIEVKGDLIIKNTSFLKNLKGLNGLTKIGGSLIISYNEDLVDISDLNQLSQLEESLKISDNDELETLKGLESLTKIKETITISYNSSLENLSGLNNIINIDNIDGYSSTGLEINSNSNLTSLEGLNSLKRVDGMLRINYNQKLENIEALSNLNRVENISIYSNNGIISLKGLENIEYINGIEISIRYNNRLDDFCAIKDLVSKISCDDTWWCDFNAYGNAYNPELEDIQSGNCKDD